MIPIRWAVAAGALSAMTLAGCGSSSTHSAATTSTTAAPGTTAASGTTAGSGTTGSSGGASLASIGPAAANSFTVSLARGPQGIFLIGASGHSLYVFDEDHGSTSACTGGCAGLWPALASSGTITAGPSVNKSELAVVHGQVADQVTYYGHLLYYFKEDTAPGQTNGTAIQGWHLLGPFGNVMLPRSLPASTTTSAPSVNY